jgi:hypothetical protein
MSCVFELYETNREKERSKPKRQHAGVRDAKVLVGYGGGGG